MPCGLPEAQEGAWRLLRALVISRHEDITGEDSGLWEALNRVLDDAVGGCDVRPLTATLAVNLGALTDRASRHAQSALTESARLRARVLLREVSERLRLDTLDIGLLRRLAWMTQEVVDELLQQASSALASMPAATRPTAHSPMPANWAASA
ncbi:hypothetical protein [Streptomyces sp. NBC_01439]|uniref:hypothetical protein n=1 Tax=Streptomyces sp. NBC_01439 TaxID=2903867 RepID=UPI002E2AA5F2|nr:hypothetical protein [Streptomyces sp. NBC_01439]